MTPKKEKKNKVCTWQWNSKNITSLDSSTSHSISIHQISKRSPIPSRNSRKRVHIFHNITQVNSRQRIIRAIKTGTRQRHKQINPNVQNIRVLYIISLPQLISRNQTRVDLVRNRGKRVRRASLVVGGNGLANPVDAGAGDGDPDKELRREDVVLDVRVGNVDGVGGEDGDGVDVEEGAHFGDFEVGVKSVAEQCAAGVGIGAGLDC